MTSIREFCLFLILTFFISGTYSKFISQCEESLDDSVIDLPDRFLLGAGTSAFQIEGAWNSSGKSETYVEWLMHKMIFTNVSADVSSDSYHNYKKDIQVINKIGLNLYRFSISWARIFPTGDVDNVNEEGVQYYHAVLDGLEKIGVKPMVLLHHFDHPVILEQSGGWLNETIIQLYKEYARFIFKEFGNQIKYFITFNEPNLFCHAIYSNDWETNHNSDLEKAFRAYTCAQNMLKAHAEVYHMYHDHFNPKKNGMISISVECDTYLAKNEKDDLSADVAFEFGCGWIAHPIFSKSGDYPELMKEWIQKGSQQIPTLSQEWVDKIRGSADFFALSHYSSHLVERSQSNSSQVGNIYLPRDSRINLSEDPSWDQASNGFSIVPSGLRSILQKIKKEYDNPVVYISENGYANRGGTDDNDRIEFMFSYIKEALDAIKYDDCKVQGYVYWSLIDGYEFKDGYSACFGLAQVDFNDPERPRTLKKSALWLREVIKSRKLSINT